MGLFHGGELSPRNRAQQDGMQQVWCTRIAVVEHVGAVQAVSGRKLIVQARGKEVFCGDLRVNDDEISSISGNGAVRERVKGKIWHHIGVDHDDCSVSEITGSSGWRENDSSLCVAQALSQSLVIGKEECLILPDRTTSCRAELIALEGRLYRLPIQDIEHIECVESTIEDIFLDGVVKGVGSGSGNGIDDAA